jgi:hypothetical protein
MTPITSVAELRLAIRELESAKHLQWPVLRQQLIDAADEFRPRNLVKTTVKSFFGGQDLKSVAFHSVLGVTTGLVASTVLRRVAVGPVSKFLSGTIMGMISNKKVLKHSPGVVAIGARLLNKIFSRRE